MISFQYSAETYSGSPLRGTLDAPDADSARRQLAALGLRVIELAPAAQSAPAVRLGAADLAAFNEYLLQISSAGLPLEQGLRAVSAELRTGKLKQALDGLATDLERGTPIEQAIETHRAGFPPLYARLLDAGIKSANLPGVLHRFGRHLETVAELRDALWRACAYPLVVLGALTLLLTFLGYYVLPIYFQTLQGFALTRRRWSPRTGMVTERFEAELPTMAQALYWLARATPWIVVVLTGIFVASWLIYRLLRTTGHERGWVDGVLHRLPIIGPALRANAVASWLDVLAIGTGAGLDLPRALGLASQAVGLPTLRRDAQAIAAQIEQGGSASSAVLQRLPATVPMAIDTARQSDQLPRTLAALALRYREQAERRIRLIPGRVLPPLLILIGLLSGAILYSLWMPLNTLLRGMTSF